MPTSERVAMLEMLIHRNYSSNGLLSKHRRVHLLCSPLPPISVGPFVGHPSEGFVSFAKVARAPFFSCSLAKGEGRLFLSVFHRAANHRAILYGFHYRDHSTRWPSFRISYQPKTSRSPPHSLLNEGKEEGSYREGQLLTIYVNSCVYSHFIIFLKKEDDEDPDHHGRIRSQILQLSNESREKMRKTKECKQTNASPNVENLRITP
ncbi:unnamed protein product [Victoria cruziana]